MVKQNILLAGATGYLGGYIARELAKRALQTTVIVRNKNKFQQESSHFKIVEAEVTKPGTLQGVFEGIDTVISSVGITRQKDGLTYMDVDYQANINLIEAAKAAGVKKFIYVSVFNGEKLRELKICEAKEKLVDYLKTAGLEYCIIRPNGFFSDMGDFLKMAKGGKVYLFGDGYKRLNPIHGEDLAEVCVDAITSKEAVINIGGPEIFSQNEIGALALKAYGKPVKIMHLPDWIRRFIIGSLRTFTSSKTYGPIEFFMTTLTMDMVSPTYGHLKLADFFNQKVKEQSQQKS